MLQNVFNLCFMCLVCLLFSEEYTYQYKVDYERTLNTVTCIHLKYYCIAGI